VADRVETFSLQFGEEVESYERLKCGEFDDAVSSSSANGLTALTPPRMLTRTITSGTATNTRAYDRRSGDDAGDGRTRPLLGAAVDVLGGALEGEAGHRGLADAGGGADREGAVLPARSRFIGGYSVVLDAPS